MEWIFSEKPVPYEDAIQTMETRVEAIRESKAEELVWGLQHPSLYTAGTSAKAKDLIANDFPVYETGRGGQYTYHGPEQLVTYVMCNLKKRQQDPDLKIYIWSLEEWIIRTLAQFDITSERREGRIGIWVDTPTGEKKIAAIGVRIRHWVTYHGLAINVNPDLSHFQGIVPCGIKEFGVTSMHDMGKKVSVEDVFKVLRDTQNQIPLLANDEKDLVGSK